jgi:hypothetical protein
MQAGIIKLALTGGENERRAVFKSLKMGKKSIVARFGFIWQIVSNR